MSTKLSEMFENILKRNPTQHLAFWYRQYCIPVLNRDFNNIVMEESEFNTVCTHPGEYRKLFATGSGLQTLWYFYHSPTFHKLFMIWISESGKHSGFRDDIERIKLIRETKVSP